MRRSHLLPVILAVGVLWPSAPVLAQRGRIAVRITAESASYDAVAGTPIMVSVIQNGAIVQQGEQTVNNTVVFGVDPGVYDVRLEGAGAVTDEKRGITVTAGRDVNLLGGPMRAGEGLHVVEYATGGFSREELAERLQRIEDAVRAVEQTLRELTGRVAQLDSAIVDSRSPAR